MADAKKAKEPPSGGESKRTAAPATESDKVAVTNTSRSHPVGFHYVGGSQRLGPLETRELGRVCLASPELAQLVRSGVVTVTEVAPGGAREGEGGEADAARPRSEERAATRTRSSKEG